MKDCGRAGPNKVPFVIAMVTEGGRPRRLVLQTVTSHNTADIKRFARARLAGDVHVVSDGLGCFRAVEELGCTYTAIVTSRIDGAKRLAVFRSMNTILGNVKTAIAGNSYALRRHYVARYLAEFQDRFNRRHALKDMFADLVHNAVRTTPRPYAQIRLADGNG